MINSQEPLVFSGLFDYNTSALIVDGCLGSIVLIKSARRGLRLFVSRHSARHPQRFDEIRANIFLRGSQHPPKVAGLDVARRDAPARSAQ